MDRASASDLTKLATDHGPVPMNIGCVLMLDDASALDFDHFTSLLSDRIPAVPRLRQRLVRGPVGSGRPVWVDDGNFRLTRHLHHRQLDGTGQHRDVLAIAAEMVCQRLDRTAPLWTARLVTGLADDQAAIILVLHHVVADGLGGLALLGSLVDNDAQPDANPFPIPPPDGRTLTADAWREGLDALRRVPRRLRDGCTVNDLVRPSPVASSRLCVDAVSSRTAWPSPCRSQPDARQAQSRWETMSG